MNRIKYRKATVVLLMAILISPLLFPDAVAVANFPVPAPDKHPFQTALKFYSMITGNDADYLVPEIASLAGDHPNVHVVSLKTLCDIHAYLTGIPAPDQVQLAQLTSIFPGWAPLYINNNGYSLDDRILIATGIIDQSLIDEITSAIRSTGFDPDIIPEKRGYVVLLKDVIPAHYLTDRVVIDRTTGEIVQWPLMKLRAEMNIPAYRWRIWHVTPTGEHLMVDWPVVVGKITTPSKVADLPMDVLEHYPHWTDPQTGKYVAPGPANPLGLWKLKSSINKRLWYYHGTNQPKYLTRPYRAISHGCIRNDNDNIRRLGILLLTHNAGIEAAPGLVTGRTDIINLKRFRKVPLVAPVMAKNVYDTIESVLRTPTDESLLVFYPNVYNVKWQSSLYRPTSLSHLKKELAKIGVDPADLDETKLRKTAHNMRYLRRTAHVELSSLMAE